MKKEKVICFRLKTHEYIYLKDYAKGKKKTLSEVIRRIIKEYLRDYS